MDKWHDDVIRVMVVDDHALLRRRLMVLLEGEDDVDLVAEANEGEHAIALAGGAVPDVAVIGMRVEHIGGPRTAAGIREIVPSCHVVVLITVDDEADAIRAIKAGVRGFVNRDTVEQTPTVVRAVASGTVALPPLVAKQLVAEYDVLAAQRGSVQQQLDPPDLDERERAVLSELAAGRSYTGAAEALGVADVTARNLAANAVEKLYRHARTEAVLYAVGERLFADR